MEFNNNKVECSICLSSIDVDLVRTECNHIYHNTCLVRLISNHRSCPYCRRMLSIAGVIAVTGAVIIISDEEEEQEDTERNVEALTNENESEINHADESVNQLVVDLVSSAGIAEDDGNVVAHFDENAFNYDKNKQFCIE